MSLTDGSAAVAGFSWSDEDDVVVAIFSFRREGPPLGPHSGVEGVEEAAGRW